MSSARSPRGNPAMGDIVRSMAVIGVIILALYGFGKLFTQEPAGPQAIDYAMIVGQARPAADFALAAPASLPKGWKATSARYEPNSWHLGVQTDDEEYIGLEQVKSSIDRAVGKWAEGSKAAGTAEVAGETWTVRKGPQDRITFVRREAGLTTLVNATAPRPVVEAYLSTLSTS